MAWSPVLSLLFGVMAYRQIVGPLRELEGLAGRVRATKDYGLRASLDRRDEIGQPATAFNAMLAELAAAREREVSGSGAQRGDAGRASRGWPGSRRWASWQPRLRMKSTSRSPRS